MNINDTLKFQNYGLPDDILRRKLHGDYAGAIRLIDRRVEEGGLSEALRNSLLVHKEICKRLPGEFPYSRANALEIIRTHIPDFTMDELDGLIDTRRIRWIYVEGEVRIFDQFFSSLRKAVPEFAQRVNANLPSADGTATGSEEDRRLDIVISKMKANGTMTNRIRVRAGMKLKDGFFTPGMFLRVHLPIPAACQQQSDIRIEKIWPDNGRVAPEDALQRTVCWEEYLQENHEFVVEYSYLHTEKFTDAYNGKGAANTLASDLQEQAPHIVFTPYIRALCEELSHGIDDPLGKARAFYDFITLNMKYTYVPSYFVMENIAENCARNYTGDCGIFALLFITLCRCAGIPAKWQSGLTAEPDFIGCHDWAQFYIEPYGWIFADPSYGIGAVRRGKDERRQFYFGNLDPYRMVANSAFHENFTIPMEHWRADPYDNQSGEMESAERSYGPEEYETSMEILCCEEV